MTIVTVLKESDARYNYHDYEDMNYSCAFHIFGKFVLFVVGT